MAKEEEAHEFAQLHGLLRQANAHTVVQKFVLKTLGMTPVADFYGIIEAEALEEELVEVIMKDNPLQASRIRAAAWRAVQEGH